MLKKDRFRMTYTVSLLSLFADFLNCILFFFTIRQQLQLLKNSTALRNNDASDICTQKRFNECED